VTGFQAPAPGEHPRLFFRKTDLPALRARAKTPEGQAILARCRQLLGGAKSARTQSDDYTLWDGAAFGFLYQITGETRYAEMARESVEHAWKPGVTDKDKRYSLDPPNEPMRYGPSLAAVAMAYDLCYDAWPEEFRTAQAQKIQNHSGQCKKRGGVISLERMALKADNPNPVSNHFGLQVGGAGLALLAIQGDPGTDDAKIQEWLKGVDRQARKVMKEDFGETGYFAEHAGPGVINMTWTFTPWLLAERVAAGRDWLSARPDALGAEWMTLRFVFQTLPVNGRPLYLNPSPEGGYGTEHVAQNGGHHGAKFCQGFGAIQTHRKPAMRWVYDQFVAPWEASQYPDQVRPGEIAYDVLTYPHRALFAFVNWPFDQPADNPEKTIPKAISDRRYGHFLFRNRWQDADDIVVGVLLGARNDRNVKRLMVWGLGEQLEFANLPILIQGSSHVGQVQPIRIWKPAADGSGILAIANTSVAVDFSKSSGADAVVIVTGDGATGNLQGGGPRSKATVVQVGERTYAILTLSSGSHPEPVVEGNTVKLGAQTIGFDGTALTLATMAAPPTIPQ
jgi:hypothetical protein